VQSEIAAGEVKKGNQKKGNSDKKVKRRGGGSWKKGAGGGSKIGSVRGTADVVQRTKITKISERPKEQEENPIIKRVFGRGNYSEGKLKSTPKDRGEEEKPVL